MECRYLYIVKAIGPDAGPTWLTTPKREGRRTFGTRDLAEAFQTRMAAEDAVSAMVTGAYCVGIDFSVEAAD